MRCALWKRHENYLPPYDDKRAIGRVRFRRGRARLAGWAVHTAVDVLALFCWLHRDALVAALEREIDELADDSAALTDEERATRESELLADLLRAERLEELLVVAAENEGREVMRRPNADPRAVLNLSSALPGLER
jgi:hypothetical protein